MYQFYKAYLWLTQITGGNEGICLPSDFQLFSNVLQNDSDVFSTYQYVSLIPALELLKPKFKS